MHVLAAPDKFRGSLTAGEVAAAISAGAQRAGRECLEMPLADGGEGSLDALGGANRSTTVTGPLGEPLEAGWRLEDGVAVIETARASGLSLAGGAAGNDPLRATTRGTGELIAAALAAGAERLIVAVGGSATTDGGLGAVEAIGATFTVPVQVACDVQTVFSEAARVFGPQKGAGPNEVRALELRLDALAERYRDIFGVDVSWLPGSGAAGGLAGGLAALGAELVSGFDLIAAEAGLDRALDGAAFVVTGEGKVDRTSFAGKVVGGVVARCEARALGALVIAGEAEPGLYSPVPGISLVERFGPERAWAEPAACIEEAVADVLTDRGSAWQT